jgi:DNA-binding winged helix-turn-helix (wHTH) protein/predicted ATPase
MPDAPALHFGDYRLDCANACLWRGAQPLHLTPKAFAVLHTLVQHAGQLVTKDALLHAAWPETAVSEAALTICISELRKVLGETAQTPRYIATVHRRGYRFVAPVRVASAADAAPYGPVTPAAPELPAPPLLVGYEAELARLHACFATAQAGQRQVVLVAGDAGMGKTTLVEAFRTQLSAAGVCLVAWGQCLAHYGAGEAYLPVLDALGRLGRGPAQAQLRAVLRQYAPTWLGQLPALGHGAGGATAPALGPGGTPERMLRELAEALEALTAAQPLVLVLEDLHWSDHATLDLLAWLARRREPARLLVVGTYRPIDVIVHAHPLRAVQQDLILRQQGVEVRLEGLSEAAVGAYLAARLAGGALPAGLVAVLAQRTAGQPLFMVQMVEAWLQARRVVKVGERWEVPEGLTALATEVPASVRQLLEQQLEDCPAAAQRVLEAASVVGETFAAAAVAAGLGVAVVEVEERCATLARQGRFVRAQGIEEWPDGTVTECYGFVHALHQQVVYEHVPAARRLRLHRQIGARLEAGYGDCSAAMAAALAMHFVRGQESDRAVYWLQQAGENAFKRSAYAEALAHLTQGMDLLAALPDSAERTHRELTLLLALGPVLYAVKGWVSPDLARLYTRARALCRDAEDPQFFPVLYGLWQVHSDRGELGPAQELAAQFLHLTQRLHDPALEVVGCLMMGATLFRQGEFAAALRHLLHGTRFSDPQQHQTLSALYMADPSGACHGFAAHVLWLLGYPDQALEQSQAALTLAEQLAHPLSLAQAQYFRTVLCHFRREVPQAQVWAETALAYAQAQGFPSWEAQTTLLRGWARAMQGDMQEGMAQIATGVAMFQTAEGELPLPYPLSLLAEALYVNGQMAEGIQVLAKVLTLMERGGICWWKAEIYRLMGECLWRQGEPDPIGAEQQFHQALTLARQQQAKSLELRAAMSLSRLWQEQGKRHAARTLLEPLYAWFTEGFATADLQEARALLEVLA